MPASVGTKKPTSRKTSANRAIGAQIFVTVVLHSENSSFGTYRSYYALPSLSTAEGKNANFQFCKKRIANSTNIGFSRNISSTSATAGDSTSVMYPMAAILFMRSISA